MKAGRSVELLLEACERHGASTGMDADRTGGERHDGKERRETQRLPRRSKALEGVTP